MYKITSTEERNEKATDFETKSMLYMMNYYSNADKVEWFVIDFFNDVTGVDSLCSECFDIQSKGVKDISPMQLGEITRLGDFYQDNGWVFTQVDGKRCNPSYFTHEMSRLCAEAGVPHCNVHSLRHTAAATMLMSGVSISVVAQRLGHARPSTSTDIYGYVLQTAEASAANATSEYLNSIASKPMVTEAVNELDEAAKFREAKAEMQRLGFSDYNEYLDYLEFKRLKEIRKAPR